MAESMVTREVEEIMARGGALAESERAMLANTDHGRLIDGVWVNELHRAFVLGAIAALHAHGYEIKKRDPDMMVIKEIETR